jgi:hypothetical protein
MVSNAVPTTEEQPVCLSVAIPPECVSDFVCPVTSVSVR